MTPQEHCTKVLSRCDDLVAKGTVPVVVFDLDATLFDNGPRTWQILVEFADSTGNNDLRRKLDDMPRYGLPYLLKDILGVVGVDDQALIEEATAFWFKRFFTDDYQRYDEPIVGAVPFAKALFEKGATLVYLTGRDSPGMLVGCAASLRQHGFPVGLPHTAMVLKPDFETPDEAFKKDAVKFIDGLGAVVAAYDNEPGNCNLFREAWPEAEVVFMDTHHAPGAPALLEGIDAIKAFD